MIVRLSTEQAVVGGGSQFDGLIIVIIITIFNPSIVIIIIIMMAYCRLVYIRYSITAILSLISIMIIMSIMSYQRGWDTCVPTPKMAFFSVFKAFLFLKYFKNNLGLIESSFNP